MSKKVRELKSRRAALVAQLTDLTKGAEAAGRDLSDTEMESFGDLKAKIEGLDKQIEAAEYADKAAASIGVEVTGARIDVTDNREADPRRGFNSFGEFAQSVFSAGANRHSAGIDDRLLVGAAAPTTFGGESSGSDGGFLIPPEFSREIWTHSLEEESILPYTDNTEVSGNGMVFPKDETTPWGTDGIRAYWQAEALAGNGSKPKLSTTAMRLHKMMVLVPITDELLSDGVAVGSYITGKLPVSIRWKTDESLLFGDGNGCPAGALKSRAAVVQDKESGQAAGSLVPLNLAGMVSRLPPGSFGRSFWLMNNDVLPYLWTLNQNGQILYLPFGGGAGSMQQSPYGTLLGRPIVVSQHAKSFGAQGDINLLDMKYYRTITKSEGIRTDVSMHLYFDADAAAFRATYRIDGQPAITNPISPANGSKTLSPFVQLGAR